MESKRYVIVGGSAAGMAAAQTIRSHDPFGTIQVLSEEADSPYFRPMIPFIISRKKEADQIYLQGRGPYQARSITVRLNPRAIRIDRYVYRFSPPGSADWWTRRYIGPYLDPITLDDPR